MIISNLSFSGLDIPNAAVKIKEISYSEITRTARVVFSVHASAEVAAQHNAPEITTLVFDLPEWSGTALGAAVFEGTYQWAIESGSIVPVQVEVSPDPEVDPNAPPADSPPDGYQ